MVVAHVSLDSFIDSKSKSSVSGAEFPSLSLLMDDCNFHKHLLGHGHLQNLYFFKTSNAFCLTNSVNSH